MKIFDYDAICQKGIITLKKYPMVLISALVATVMGCIFFHDSFHGYQNDSMLQLSLTACLGIPVFLAISIIMRAKERRSVRALTIILNVIVCVLLSIFYIFAKSDNFEWYISLLLYAISAHLLVSLSAHIGNPDEMSFWQFNKNLLFRIITSLFFSSVLYIGISLALVATRYLFNINLDMVVYTYTFCIIFGLFNTWYFLSGIKINTIITDVDESYNKFDYPIILKMFTQYILIPLLFVYVIILLCYELKILIEWTLPVGWVSIMILIYSITGIFTVLLSYPASFDREKRLIKLFTKTFYLTLFPFIVLFVLAVTRRFSDYGITESRYVLFVTAIWLTATALYFTLSRKKRIKVIPASLLVICLLISCGPWGMFSVSENSQINRLMSILKDNGVIVNHEIQNSSSICSKDFSNIYSILEYLKKYHSLEKLTDTLNYNSNVQLKYSSDCDYLEVLLKAIVIDSTILNDNNKGKYYFNVINTFYSNKKSSTINIDGYSYFFKYITINYNRQEYDIKIVNSDIFKIKKSDNLMNLEIESDSHQKLVFNLEDVLILLRDKHKKNIEPDKNDLMIASENDDLKGLLVINEINCFSQMNVVNVNSIDAFIFLTIKK